MCHSVFSLTSSTLSLIQYTIQNSQGNFVQFRTRKFICANIWDHNLSLSSAKWIQSILPTPCFKYYFNNILKSTSITSKWFFFLHVSPPKSCMYISSHHVCHMPNQFYPSWFDNMNNTWWVVLIIKAHHRLGSCGILSHPPS